MRNPTAVLIAAVLLAAAAHAAPVPADQLQGGDPAKSPAGNAMARPPQEAWKVELLRRPLRAFCVDFNWQVKGNDLWFAAPGHWADADPAAQVQWCKAAGVNCIQTLILSCNGYAWYKGVPIPEQPGLKYDFLTEVAKQGHRQQMLVMGYYCIGANSLWGRNHPDQSYGTPAATHIPLTGDYIDYLCGSVKDVLERTEIDGFMLDWMSNTSGRWLDCEKKMYQELMAVPFPGAEQVTAAEKKAFDQKAVERCWTRIRDTARKVKPDCILWPNGLNHLNLAGVDWLLNEGPEVGKTAAALRQLAANRPVRIIQNQVGWPSHDARKVFADARYARWDFYGFAAPYDNGLPLPVADYLGKPVAEFKGVDRMTINDRNIAALVRFYLGYTLGAETNAAQTNVTPAGPEAQAPARASLPRVLLIGDSICGGYEKGVKRLLEGKAEVSMIPGNGEHTGTGLKKIDAWLGDGRWDVIHFNWGLWDIAHRHPQSKNPGHLDKVNGQLTTSLEDYEKNLRLLVARLKQTGAKLVWASTTPVPDGEPRRIAGDEVKYNAVAARVMTENGIAIDDLHAAALPHLAKIQQPHNVHFNGAGCDLLARQVAQVILQQLELQNSSPGKGDSKPASQPAGANSAVSQMQADFLKLKFGLFIHFNLETFKGVQWVAGYHSPADFNPGGRIDSDAWADAAKSAGMQYAVLTAKHVSGFCLWDSKYTTYDVMNPACPYQQDLVAQFIKSFKSRGLKVGLYYCWRNPGFGSPDKYKVLPPECDPATHTLQEQIAFQEKQIAELVEKYPEVFYIWNDGLDPDILPAENALRFFRGLRPGLLASANWWDWGKKGMPYADIAVKEMRQFPENNTAPGETCWCLEQGWFWHEGARPKTAPQVLGLLHTVNARHSNFLLNAGPNQQGRFEEASVKVLAEVGALQSESRGKPVDQAGSN